MATAPPLAGRLEVALVLAITVRPGTAGTAKLEEVGEPAAADGGILVEALVLGVCGTDREIVHGEVGAAPPGRERLVLGHESLGRVLEAPAGGPVQAGDLVVGIVRRPDPVPCASCAAGEWDMCRNGQYTERGIKGLDGYGSQRYRLPEGYAVPVDAGLGRLGVLLEPASVVAKAWEQVDRIGRRAAWAPRRVLVTGAGPIGLLAALLGVQRGLEVHVLDRVTEGPKPRLVAALGATYHSGKVADAADVDVIVETTGAVPVLRDALQQVQPAGVVCLLGLGGGEPAPLDLAAVNNHLVMGNRLVVGCVNANRRHYQAAAAALAAADRGWLGGLVTRQVPLDRFDEALAKRPGDVKVTVTFDG